MVFGEGGGVEVAEVAVEVVGPVEPDFLLRLHEDQIIKETLSSFPKYFALSSEQLSVQSFDNVFDVDLILYFFYRQDMQTRIDWTTGGLSFYDVDPPKSEHAEDFASDPAINKQFDPLPSHKQIARLSLEERVNLIKSVGCEVVGEEHIADRLQKKEFIRCYDGFEPSGRIHIAQGLLRAINVNKMVEAGAIFYFWVADYFAMLNGKFDGDLQKIRTVGAYFVEVWKAVGMKMSNVKFIWASEEINRRSNEYWLGVMRVACRNSIARIKKCATIMGRNESDGLKVSQMIYPCMQCTDIFFLDVDVCQLGIDQRKVNMLAIEMADHKGDKPIIVSHPMVSGLLEGQEKMSKSNSDSAIFMEDPPEEVSRKIKKSFCPERTIEGNPVLDYTKTIVFGARKQLQIVRSAQNGGNKTYHSYEQLAADFAAGGLHPADLKPAVAKVLNELIEPVRRHFQNDPQARALLKKVQSYNKEAAEKAKKMGEEEEEE